MKALTYTIVALVSIAFGIAALWWFTVGASIREHERRVSNAQSLLRGYSESDWADLYRSCIPLFEKDVLDQDDWPDRVNNLNPYNLDVDGDKLTMQFTGGFDDESLYLFVLRRDTQLFDDPSPEKAGIVIVGPAGLPDRPFTQ